MGKQYEGCARVASQVRMVSDLTDVALMTSALKAFDVNDLRTACRARPDIPATRIAYTIGGIKQNAPKSRLIALLVQSLLACPAGVTMRTEQQRQISSRGGETADRPN